LIEKKLKHDAHNMEHKSRTPQGSYHMKYTNLCNEEKILKPSTPRYLTKKPNHK
jgi:hypothetical protein